MDLASGSLTSMTEIQNQNSDQYSKTQNKQRNKGGKIANYMFSLHPLLVFIFSFSSVLFLAPKPRPVKPADNQKRTRTILFVEKPITDGEGDARPNPGK